MKKMTALDDLQLNELNMDELMSVNGGGWWSRAKRKTKNVFKSVKVQTGPIFTSLGIAALVALGVLSGGPSQPSAAVRG